jgi:hypothetical protein
MGPAVLRGCSSASSTGKIIGGRCQAMEAMVWVRPQEGHELEEELWRARRSADIGTDNHCV